LADVETLRASLRAFGRLRAEAAPTAHSAARDQAVGMATEVLPLDSTKTFVGPNSTYYDEMWRTMEWRRRYRSWNWPAALTMGGWLAYRRLYDHAILQAVWLTLIALLALSGTPVKLLAMAQLIVAGLLGVYGNALYRIRFRRAAETAARHDGDYPAQLAALAAAGGTDARAVWIMGLGVAAIVAGLVAFRRSLDGVHLIL
jgi:hypothetical protein